MIEIKKLHKSYGNHKVIKDLSMLFNSNGIDIIVGANGSGKTTLFNSIADVTLFDDGEIKIDDINNTEKKAKLKMYYIPSDFYLPEYLSGKEYAEFVFSRYEEIDYEFFNLVINLYNLKDSMKKMIKEYSYGMKKKIQIAISLAIKVNYILADEIFNGLDYESYLLTEHLIKRFSQDRKFILISHNMDFISRSNNTNVYLLKNGAVSLVDDAREIEGIVVNSGELRSSYEKVDRFFANNKIINK